jgi:hypothetical protein
MGEKKQIFNAFVFIHFLFAYFVYFAVRQFFELKTKN